MGIAPTALHEMLAPAVMERLTLLTNHVIGREPAAMDRLRPHAGRTLSLRVSGWPAFLPPLPALDFRITPAGLVEWCGTEGVTAPDLTVQVQAPPPLEALLGALSGQRPAVHVEGDADLAAAVNWLFDHLRWDVADDLHRLVGPAAAQGLVDLAGRARTGLAEAARGAGEFAARWRPGAQ